MKVEIENLAKVKKANIDLNAITVIAGFNDTGKSTIGKALSAAFLSSQDINERVRNAKKNLL